MSDQEALTPRVFIFRHGETEWAKLGRSTGITDVDLTQAGAAQVSSAAVMLVGAGKLIDPSRLVHIFVSPRSRATKTFDLLLAHSSSVAGKVTYTEDIAEWNYGDYEGLTNQEIRGLRKERGLDLEREWDVFSDGCEGGESPQQITNRLDRLIRQIRDMQKPYMHGEKHADVLVVAHGLIFRAFWRLWVGLSIDTPLRMMMDPGEVAILSYKKNDVNQPAFHLGVPLSSEKERGY